MAVRKAIFALLTGVASLSGCSFNSSVAPIESRNTSSDRASVELENIAPIYVVKPGDTLYSIAWRAGQDFRRLAQWNHIEPPYTIKYGQRIKLSPTLAEAPQSSVKSQQPALVEQNGDDITVETLPAELPANGQNASRNQVANKKQAKAIVKKPGKIAKSNAKKLVFHKVRRWLWPATGKHRRVVSQKRGMDGIAIYGKRGQAVKAAAAGEVVYQGSGILGLGKLIIVKHNETYLSAYAHNDQILVKEGQSIAQGQMIAKMGKSDADRVNLYFEIRKNGKPVNPLKVLQ